MDEGDRILLGRVVADVQQVPVDEVGEMLLVHCRVCGRTEPVTSGVDHHRGYCDHGLRRDQLLLGASIGRVAGLLQKNVLTRRQWTSREQLRIAIITWIERTYHRRRRQALLGRLTPIEFEAIMTPPATQAA